MIYKIINSGSHGNCTILNDSIAIDLGVSYKKLGDYASKIKFVLLTHVHSDHFNRTTIKKLHMEHPSVKFVCLEHLVVELAKVVSMQNILVRKPDVSYDLDICKVAAFLLDHDVPNNGWRIMIGDEKCIYATDTSSIDVKAEDYDLYLIEANYTVEEMLRKINIKKQNGEYAYEVRAFQNHLSKQECDSFLERNMGKNSEYVYMHVRKDKDEKMEIDNNYM